MLDTAEDFDLDSLLYDIVKFDPNKIVQQQQKPLQHARQHDVVDGVPSVKDSQSEAPNAESANPSEQQQPGQEEGTVSVVTCVAS